MTTSTATDFSDLPDEELRIGLGMVLMAVTDPMCEPDVRESLMEFGQDIREELGRRRTSPETATAIPALSAIHREAT